MSVEYDVKVFKSGNSVAVRLPKALGLQPGASLRLREESGYYILDKAAGSLKITGEGWIGKLPEIQPLTRDQRAFEPSPRPWDEPSWNGWTPDA